MITGTIGGISPLQIFSSASLEIFTLFSCDSFDRFFAASPILDGCVKACVVGDDHKPVALVFTDSISELGDELEIQRICALITFDEGHCPVGFLELDQTFITHMRTVSGIKNNQLCLISREFQKRNPEISDIFAVY